MAAASSSAPARSRDRTVEESPGYGWVLFAGTMIAIVGTLNFIYGIAAISDSKFYVKDAQYVISDLNTWGWFLVVIGVVQVLAAFAIWIQAEWGRWVGVLSAGINMIIQLLVIPGNPFLALALFSIDVLIIYGLVAHGGRPARR